MRPTNVTRENGILQPPAPRGCGSRRNRMKPWRASALALPFLWLVVAVPVRADVPQRLLDLMAQGKTENDLGHAEVATKAFAAVADAADSTPALRAEALVRLGAVRRAAGDATGAALAFERVASAPDLDPDTKKLLVQALG